MLRSIPIGWNRSPAFQCLSVIVSPIAPGEKDKPVVPQEKRFNDYGVRNGSDDLSVKVM